jgi:hypothetical protein
MSDEKPDKGPLSSSEKLALEFTLISFCLLLSTVMLSGAYWIVMWVLNYEF